MRAFVNLMEESERDHQGRPFAPYDPIVRELCPDATCMRFPIRDLSTPSESQLHAILDAVDSSIDQGKAVYLHCWGGVGRTGTVVACWLLEHQRATHDDVLPALATLRRQDRERGGKASPENATQTGFVAARVPRG